MRRFRRFWLLIFLLGLVSFAHAQDFHVVLDPGHGGSDMGIVHGDLREKDLTLALAQAIEADLRTRESILVTLTRKGDDLLSFTERRRIASSIQEGVFLSLHFATSSDRMLSGTHTFMQKHTLVTTPKKLLPIEQSQDQVLHLSYLLGEQITSALTALSGMSKLHVSEHPLAPLIGISIPAVVIELDYLSHLEAPSWLNAEKQLQAARLIAGAIDRYRLERKNPANEQTTSR